ncbi:MAG: 3-dehydroquinate synthase [Putridiphycobacter sp.]
MIKEILDSNQTIVFTSKLFETINHELKTHFSNSKKVIFTDENVYDLWIENLISSVEELHGAEIIQVPAGETSKSIEIAHQLWATLADYQISRKDLVINFGGGVVSDLGGFVASTYKRGIDFINIPTTLLSQVDASVGGKTGIDLGNHKNIIGTFSNPKKVFIDPIFLSTLDDVQIKSGFAEMLKHGLIADEKHWQNLIALPDLSIPNLSALIFDSISIKHEIVSKDPNELDIRKSLNFGHTIGHAFESFYLTQNISIPHGFAIGWGMVVETRLALDSGLIHEKFQTEIESKLKAIYGKCNLKTNQIPDLIKIMGNDKKNEGQLLNFSLPTEIGKCKINCEIEHEKVEAVLEAYLD